jgi:hypothetical protein
MIAFFFLHKDLFFLYTSSTGLQTLVCPQKKMFFWLADNGAYTLSFTS